MTIHPHPDHGLFSQARAIGGACWIERSMFRILGSWSAAESEPRIVLAFDDHAGRHAWHADVLFDRLPDLADVDPDDLVVAPSDSVAAVIDDIETLPDTASRLVGAHGVMCTHLVVRYRRLLQQVPVVSSPSTHRWIARIIDDVVDEWMWGEDAIADLVRTTDDVEAMSGVRRRLELVLLTDGSTDRA